ALPFAPADGDRFAILAATSASTGSGGASAAEVWSYAVRQLTTGALSGGGSLATATDAANIRADIAALNNISAADVWTYATRTITGEVALTEASRKAIWDTACAILNTSGSVGKQVCDNLDAAVSSRSTLTAAQVWAEATRTITGLTDPALAAIANSIWTNATRTLTYYGNDITAKDVWDVLTSSLTTIDSIGKLLVTNVDETISSRSSQSSLDTLSQNVATTSALVDTSVSSRASQSSLDAHESAQAAFRTQTTNTLGTMTTNIAAILTQLSTIETKIDTITSTLNSMNTVLGEMDTKIDSIKTTVEDTNTKVTAMQTVTNNILAKWGSYDAATIIGYVDTLETNLGNPNDATSSATVFGKLNYIKENSGGTIDLIYAQAQSTHTKLLEVQTELGFNGKSTTAYDEMIAIKGYVDTLESSLATLDTRTTNIYNSVVTVSNDLKTVTDQIGKVSVDSFTQLFEVKKADIDYLKNKIIELKAVADINRQLLEKAVNQPIVKVIMEWGSVIIKFVIANPSDSTTQKIPFKAFLPKEVKQEYIMDLGGLNLSYDTSTEQYYVFADITLPAGESVIRSVEIKDIWTISEDEVASLRKQADELSSALKNTSYFAQGLTLKTDINTRLDKIVRKQKESNATPQDHILAYRENLEDMKAVNDNLKGLKDLVLNSGAGSNFLASIGGIQTFATWGIVLVLIFGMGALGMFYYQLWRRKVVTVTAGKGKKRKTMELPTPMPFVLPGFNLAWLKKILFGWLMLAKDILNAATRLVRRLIQLVSPHAKSVAGKVQSIPQKTLIIVLAVGVTTTTIAGGVMVMRNALNKNKTQVMGTAVTAPTSTPHSTSSGQALSSKEEKVKALVGEMIKEAAEKKKVNERIEELMKKTEEKASGSALPSPTPTPEKAQTMIQVKDPTDTVNVRERPEKTAPVLTKIKAGKDYPFITEEGVWYQIELSDGKKGWVNKEFVKKVEIKETVKEEDKEKVLGAVSQPQQLLVIKQTPTDWLNVREKPSLGATIVTKVYPGESYPFSEVQSGWYKILLKDLKEGWVSAQYVQPEKEITSKTSDFIEVVPPEGSGVNIREKPDKESKVIKTVYLKNKYPKLGEENGWVKIEMLDGKVGFVFKEFTQTPQ
ncbi:MAG: SH3 domain-containing protein, partial [Anaerolineales bacterium]